MRKFECNNVVAGCDGVVTGQTDDEVLAGVAEHARVAHGMDTVPDEVVAAVQAGITDA